VQEQAAGLKPDLPAKTEVTAACKASVSETLAVDDKTFVDFAHLKEQLSMTRVLDQLGLSSRLRGNGSQRKGPCPIHRGDARGRTFSVNLDEGVFCCFDKRCAKKGDIIDLWASVNAMSLREAAIDLANTFHLEPAPTKATEKRHGKGVTPTQTRHKLPSQEPVRRARPEALSTVSTYPSSRRRGLTFIVTSAAPR
jgi:CHC2-type zinc finger protein